MANTARHRKGKVNLIEVPIASATVLEIGDVVCLSDGKAVPAGSVNTSGAAAVIKEAVADAFLGVAHSASGSGDTDNVLVDISLETIYMVSLSAAAGVSIGDWLTVYAVDSLAQDQQVVADATGSYAIFVAVENHESAAGASLLAKLLPQKLLNKAPDVDE